MHDLTLVVDGILKFHRRGDDLPRGAEMIELPARQRHNSDLQAGDLVIRLRRLCPEGTAKFAIKIIFPKTSLTSPPSALREQRHSPIAEHPHPDIRQTEMIALQFRERLNRWLLEHLLQLRGRTPAADKDTMILRHRSIEPEAVTHDIRLRNRLQRLCGPDEHITADHHRMDTLRRCCHHLLIEWQLHPQQILRASLATFPREHGQRYQHLP